MTRNNIHSLREHSKGFHLILCSRVCQEFDYIEYFAGKGNLTTQMRSAQYKSVRLDLKDHTPKTKKSNYMDLTHAAGFAFSGCIA